MNRCFDFRRLQESANKEVDADKVCGFLFSLKKFKRGWLRRGEETVFFHRKANRICLY